MIETHTPHKTGMAKHPVSAATFKVPVQRRSRSSHTGSASGASAVRAPKTNGTASFGAVGVSHNESTEAAREPAAENLVLRDVPFKCIKQGSRAGRPVLDDNTATISSASPVIVAQVGSSAGRCSHCDHDLVTEDATAVSLNGDADEAWVDESTTDASDDDTVDCSAGRATPVAGSTSADEPTVSIHEDWDCNGVSTAVACRAADVIPTDRSGSSTPCNYSNVKDRSVCTARCSARPTPTSKSSVQVPLSEAVEFVLGQWAKYQYDQAATVGNIEGRNKILEVPDEFKRLLETEERCSADTPRLWIDANEVGPIELYWTHPNVVSLVEDLLRALDHEPETRDILHVDLNTLPMGKSCDKVDSEEQKAVEQRFDRYLENAACRYDDIATDIEGLLGRLQLVKEKYYEKSAFLQTVSDRRRRAFQPEVEGEYDDEEEGESDHEDEESDHDDEEGDHGDEESEQDDEDEDAEENDVDNDESEDECKCRSCRH